MNFCAFVNSTSKPPFCHCAIVTLMEYLLSKFLMVKNVSIRTATLSLAHVHSDKDNMQPSLDESFDSLLVKAIALLLVC